MTSTSQSPRDPVSRQVHWKRAPPAGGRRGSEGLENILTATGGTIITIKDELRL